MVMVVVPPVKNVTVYVHNVLSREGNRTVGPVFLAHPLREQPVKNREVDVNRRKAHTVVPQFLGVDSVLELVELNKPVVRSLHPNMPSTQIPRSRHFQRRVYVETADFPGLQHTETS